MKRNGFGETIIALDFPTKEETLRFLDLFKDEENKPFVKVGMELYYSAGPEILKEIKKRGHRIFLDLKLHDIPNTVKKAMKVLADLDVDIVNVHASGGKKMMAAAREAFSEKAGKKPLIIAVTQLTSTDSEMLRDELLIASPMNETIERYAKNASEAGLDGVVCSALEAEGIKNKVSKDFITVSPGIRFPDSAADDQVRITTPGKARDLGTDFIVVGRPITQASDPVEAYKRCQKEFI